MGRLRVQRRLKRAYLMPRIRELAAQGLTHGEISIEIGCATSTIQKWLYAERTNENQDLRRNRSRRGH